MLHFLLAARLLQRVIDERAHAAVFLEVRIDESLGFLGVDAELLRQSERRESVHDAEVHGLGPAAMLGVNHQRRHAEHLRRGQGVNVFAGAESLHQQRVAGKVRQQPQLDLRVVGRQQHVSRLGR